jgi:hypothetical protein
MLAGYHELARWKTTCPRPIESFMTIMIIHDDVDGCRFTRSNIAEHAHRCVPADTRHARSSALVAAVTVAQPSYKQPSVQGQQPLQAPTRTYTSALLHTCPFIFHDPNTRLHARSQALADSLAAQQCYNELAAIRDSCAQWPHRVQPHLPNHVPQVRDSD